MIGQKNLQNIKMIGQKNVHSIMIGQKNVYDSHNHMNKKPIDDSNSVPNYVNSEGSMMHLYRPPNNHISKIEKKHM